ncbi:uncharacterized protein G2W53_040760 [Senna tora]|uniref:Uncharacterized protein n=1 Tax=Senna tora TaxID=362788 RepID=A0A834W2A4_9FABA|nr:uncharacterized protein G2W53_040760 [Senna tora]
MKQRSKANKTSRGSSFTRPAFNIPLTSTPSRFKTAAKSSMKGEKNINKSKASLLSHISEVTSWNDVVANEVEDNTLSSHATCSASVIWAYGLWKIWSRH